MKVEQTFGVIDSHTAGHPTRVITSGIPSLRGDNVREMREDFQRRFDYLRPRLLHEPRGHSATVGLIPVPSRIADYGAFFISSYFYLDMCGHATIGYAKTLTAIGQIGPDLGSFTMETPAGVVSVGLNWDNDRELNSVSMINVPSYASDTDISLDIEGLGSISVDIAYGGVWYAVVDGRQIGLSLEPDKVSRALQAGAMIKDALNQKLKTREVHPQSVSSILFVEEKGPHDAVHLVVLASNKFDRSPCGTGTSARLAQLHHRGRIQAEQPYIARSVLGTSFNTVIRSVAVQDGRTAIVPEIRGNAHITAFSTIICEQTDPLKTGFLCQ